MTPAFLTSLLARQYLLLEEQGFLKRHPHAWLAWEPGNWVAPSSAKGAPTETRLPEPRAERTPAKGEALCFELNPQRADLTLGRNADCDISISDATVSRNHLLLQFRTPGWNVQPVGPVARTLLAGQVLDPQRWHRLESLQKIGVGGVELSYLEPKDLLKRVHAAAATLSK